MVKVGYVRGRGRKSKTAIPRPRIKTALNTTGQRWCQPSINRVYFLLKRERKSRNSKTTTVSVKPWQIAARLRDRGPAVLVLRLHGYAVAVAVFTQHRAPGSGEP